MMAFSAGRGKNAATAVTAIDIAGQKRFPDILPGNAMGGLETMASEPFSSVIVS